MQRNYRTSYVPRVVPTAGLSNAAYDEFVQIENQIVAAGVGTSTLHTYLRTWLAPWSTPPALAPGRYLTRSKGPPNNSLPSSFSASAPVYASSSSTSP